MRSRIAYVVLMHAKPHQAARLVRRLSTDRSTFLVHVDRRAPTSVEDEMRRATTGVDGVSFLKRRRCFWGGFGMVRATLGGIDQLIRTGVDFDHVVLVSGQDYPLRPAHEIERYLGAAAASSFMSVGTLPEVWSDEAHWRTEQWHLVSYTALHVPVPWRRRLPGGLVPYGGEAWVVLSRAVAVHIAGFARENPRFVRFFEHVLHPDEIFFQTILMNSDLRHTVVNDHLRYVDWTASPGHPAVLTAADFGALIRSGKLLARKFDDDVDLTILDDLDDHIDRESVGTTS
jgi:hypothetical protein